MVGQTIAHYRIVGKLGAGGMGVVYSAEDTRLGRLVAIKFVSAGLAGDRNAVERFRIEARAASALNHANICTIHDFGEHEGRPFIAMELMKGRTLRERLDSGPLKIPQVVDLGIQIADALAAAHSEGIIHRDIKPANLFLTERGPVKILDFGLAKLMPRRISSEGTAAVTSRGSDQLTTLGATLGTVSYMSPEQAAGEDLDGRTDIFSLGIVLYECATGRPPFSGKTAAVVLSAILNRAPVAPSIVSPDTPPRLEEVINNCLEKDRELRYQAAADLRAELKRVKRDLDSAQSRSTGGVEDQAEDQAEVQKGLTPAGTSRRHGVTPGVPPTPGPAGTYRRSALIVGGVVLSVALAIASYWLWPRPTVQEGPRDASLNPGGAGVTSEAAIRSQLDLAVAKLEAGDLRAALVSADDVLQAVPNHAAASDIRDRAQAQIARLDAALARTRRSLAAGDAAGAAKALEEARAITRTAPEIADLSAQLVAQFTGQAEAARQSARPPRSPALPAPAGRGEAAASASAQAAEQTRPLQPAAARAETGLAPVRTEPPVAIEPAPAGAQPTPPGPAERSVDVAARRPASAAAAPADRPADPTRSPAQAAAAPVAPPRAPDVAAPSTEDDDAAIRRVVATYARAIETKSVALFRTAKPNLSAEEERRLTAAFSGPSQRVDVTILSIERRGDRASIRLNRRDTIDAAGRQRTAESRQTMTLTRARNGWVIDEIGQ